MHRCVWRITTATLTAKMLSLSTIWSVEVGRNIPCNTVQNILRFENETPYLRGKKNCSQTKTLGPGQTINVWRPNTIKHCLVTRHANVEVSGQTVKTCLIKHRSNNWYKRLSKRGTHECLKHVWHGALQTNKISPVKHDQTAPNKVSKR